MKATSPSGRRRVVVTGIGIVTPLGCDVEGFWSAMQSGRSCIRKLTRIDLADFPVHIGGQVEEVPPTSFLSEQSLRRNDLYTNIGLHAGGMALETSGLGANADAKRPVSVIVGTAFGPMQGLQDVYDAYFSRGWRKMHPLAVPRNMFNALSSNLSIHYKLAGSQCTLAAACASGAVAIGEAFRRIQHGQDDVVLAGGADAPICGSVLGGWANLRLLSRNPEPERACRPFDSARDGLVISEGAAMLVLEEYHHARERGARVLGEIAGYGTTSDATHLTAPDCEGQSHAMRLALESAGVGAEDVDHINAHGTSTKLNDETESRAIRVTLEKHAEHVAVTANKSMLGHTMGASGALELVVALLSLRDGVVPPTINYETPDPACDLDYVPNRARRLTMRLALKNSFAFGGQNAVLVLRHPDEVLQ